MDTVAAWILFDIGILYKLVPGFILSAIAIIVVSLLTEEPGDEIKQEFDDTTGATGLRPGRAAGPESPADD